MIPISACGKGPPFGTRDWGLGPFWILDFGFWIARLLALTARCLLLTAYCLLLFPSPQPLVPNPSVHWLCCNLAFDFHYTHPGHIRVMRKNHDSFLLS